MRMERSEGERGEHQSSDDQRLCVTTCQNLRGRSFSFPTEEVSNPTEEISNPTEEVSSPTEEVSRGVWKLRRGLKQCDSCYVTMLGRSWR